MTTTVTVLISGNKACAVDVVIPGITDKIPMEPKIVKPGSFTTLTISGDQELRVREVGEFI